MQPSTHRKQHALVGGISKQSVLELIATVVRSADRSNDVMPDQKREVYVQLRSRQIAHICQQRPSKAPPEDRACLGDLLGVAKPVEPRHQGTLQRIRYTCRSRGLGVQN